eukprot:maker-scaffold_40-snap-gene-2.68-mRNA-1 protein AED:0.21 eAED:0.21 QI:314/1/1/1/1/1/2/73/411
MPWLEKNKVLFIHVPRCGGTSITKHHRVGQKAQQGKNIVQRLAIQYYYYRYQILETANFPFVTYENLFALCQYVVATVVFFFVPGLFLPYMMWSTATFLFISSTFIETAPILMRVDIIRTALMVFLGTILRGLGSDTEYLVGTNEKGYLFHLTAERCIRYGYVEKELVENCSFSIIRNPYSRMVSMYEYNKRLGETFEAFVKDFYKIYMKQYAEKKRTDSKYIYCHVLPMHAYTHGFSGEQLVNTIIKQEHLKKLVATNWENSNIPEEIQQALTGIPHANRRKRKKTWQNYYNQETMDLCLEMYLKDFELFGYDIHIPNRTDLIPKFQLEETTDIREQPPIGVEQTSKVKRRATTTGEETSETSYFKVQITEKDRKPSISGESVLVEKDNIMRKRRAASAFVINHVHLEVA